MDKNAYDLIKEIGIPGLNLLVTIVIGIFLTIYLNRKTSKEKIKSILIDSYIDYLQKYKNFVELESFNLLSRIYRELIQTIENYPDFNSDSKKTLIERFNKIIKGLDENYSPKAFDDKANFSYFTYKFAFLLGKKKYMKELQPFETIFTNKYLLNPDLKKNQIDEILNINQIKEIINNLHSKFSEKYFSNLNSSLTWHVQQISNRDQFKFFNDYNSKLADEIDKF